VPKVDQLRPTPDRVRETLFNWLHPVIQGAHCLDLFAGTGILGLEALSRGAAQVVMVEQNHQLVTQLIKNIETLGAKEVCVNRAGALDWLTQNTCRYDLVFLDPPFEQGLIAKSCALLRERGGLKPHSLIYIEAEKGFTLPERLEVIKEGTAGKVNYMLVKLL
jgi:RNA methyltransferase, RsmD family